MTNPNARTGRQSQPQQGGQKNQQQKQTDQQGRAEQRQGGEDVEETDEERNGGDADNASETTGGSESGGEDEGAK